MKFFFYVAPSFAKPFLLFVLVAFSTELYAQPAATLSVQGVLTRSDGTAVDDDTYSVSFKLFDAATGGNQVHSESIDVETIGGVYSVILGANPTSPLTAQFNTIYYLSVTVGSSELTPRPRLTHAPYALSLIGQNNTFPSTGAVIADDLQSNSYTFKASTNSGIFWAGETSIKHNGDNRILIGSNGTNYIYGATENNGALTVFGPATTNNLTVNGNETVTGNAQINGSSNTNNNTTTGGYFYTNRKQDGGGYTFIGDGGNDSGLFGFADGDIALYANNVEKIRLYPSHLELKGGDVQVFNRLQIFDVPEFDGKNMQWNPSTGLVGADNSTRRAKFNIQTLEDDFSLILKSIPRTYTRKVDPNHWEVGYIAEEMDSLGLKKLVEYDKDGRPDGYNYEKMILYVTEVLKMQDNSIKEMQAEIAALKSQNTDLHTNNAALRADNHAIQTTLSAQLEQLAKRMNALENHKETPNRK
jgi:hypothetical protein